MNDLIVLNKRSYQANFNWLKDLEKILRSKKVNLNKKKLKKYVSLALISKREIKELNKLYRKKNKVTDVLSFNLNTKEILGEIVICLEQARKQAQEKKKSLKTELKLLTVHGFLHLLGYDHEKSKKEAREQEKKELEILNLLK